ncbi:uroporphyrinogen-III C-methyltransferase [Desulfoscipio gibsoniae]|uniref:uroporphyrinogen-III C-methyltransferase n=1 Tax=Desulfoscipio gibsoniae DSM 7213 TaxID=767817 RepID=R4KG06_9FIRM|nr:uroporphyrinogen-III C-methyltransferase [Desulfoscipio gibsoniae]AGL01509.1 uroporphyrin-III C-methyltransferase [Desulfoscipio gibsoniae DSM 7213]
MTNNKGTVYLIGAGPGDPGLLTVKGLECIRQADVIVYDRLAGPRLLDQRRADAECIFVGKQPDRHTLTQEEINQLLVEKALQGLTVARLKGGDPFVFGRGGEEAEELVRHDIPFEIIPGITSAIAVPAYAGIPVTHRDFTSTLAIITGNEDPTKETSSIQWSKIATGVGTLIFLMGMGNLPGIAQKLMEHGRDPQTPVALIRWGTRPEQTTLVGSLDNIARLAKEQGFKNPAIIIVGEVVQLRDKLKWFENKPLFGKRVLVTRSREQASNLSRAIEMLGGEPVEFPTIAIAAPEDNTPLENALARLDEYSWVIFTSVNGVNYFFDTLRRLNGDIRDLKGLKLCAIGPQTGKALQRFALRVTYIPTEYRAEAIIEGLRNKISTGDRVLLPRADIARKILPEALSRLGARVDEVTAYRTVLGAGSAGTVRDMLGNGAIDIITFTSSSTVRNFVTLLEAADPARLVGNALVACIGPITAGTARELGLPVHIEAKEYTINGLLQAILNYFVSTS